MKFFAAFILLFVLIASIGAHKFAYGKPVKYKRCETVTSSSVKYSQQPVVKTKYVYSTEVKKVPSTFKTYITTTSTYKHVSTICNKH
ncbi:hypothetical protein Anas_07313 [Armadillidium nasatum]|uniref:Uncharacterized protein n=1 Tax=Armadillidium nasatum TaxID=96803 RepID=A0A5N5SSM5_9CRUS|nr:hypothetical protein Anas_07313 [Armadillidium nasatum]